MSSVIQEKFCGVLPSSTGSRMKRKLDPQDAQVLVTRNKLKRDDVEAADHPETSTSSTTVHDLPTEVLMGIFSWFTVRELCLTISPVCKLWHLTSRHHSLWKHLSFKGPRATTEHLCLLLSHATQLQSLQLVNREDATAVLRQVAVSNRNLQILIVKECDGSPQQYRINLGVLLKLIKNCTKLVEITMKHTYFYCERFLKVMSNVLPALKRINISYNIHLGSRSVNRIVRNSKPLEGVCIFTFEYNINDNDINELCTRMRDSLKILKINAVELTDNAMKSIVQCCCLHTLRICFAKCLSDDGILLLTTLHNLSSLEVTHADGVSSEGWHELFIRSNWNYMRKLCLVACSKVNNKVLKSIGGNCPNLQTINLSFCKRLTKLGLSKIIKGCKQLTFLEVQYTAINVVQCFPLIPTYLPNLRYLAYMYFNERVEKTELIDASQILHDLQKKLPNLAIHSSVLLFK